MTVAFLMQLWVEGAQNVAISQLSYIMTGITAAKTSHSRTIDEFEDILVWNTLIHLKPHFYENGEYFLMYLYIRPNCVLLEIHMPTKDSHLIRIVYLSIISYSRPWVV